MASHHPTLKVGPLEVSVDLAENTVMVTFAGQGLALVVVPAMGAAGADARYWIEGNPDTGIEPLPPTRYLVAGCPAGELFERLFVGDLGVGPEGADAAKLAAEVAGRPQWRLVEFTVDSGDPKVGQLRYRFAYDDRHGEPAEALDAAIQAWLGSIHTPSNGPLSLTQAIEALPPTTLAHHGLRASPEEPADEVTLDDGWVTDA